MQEPFWDYMSKGMVKATQVILNKVGIKMTLIGDLDYVLTQTKLKQTNVTSNVTIGE